MALLGGIKALLGEIKALFEGGSWQWERMPTCLKGSLGALTWRRAARWAHGGRGNAVAGNAGCATVKELDFSLGEC